MKKILTMLIFSFSFTLLYSQESEQGDKYSNCMKKTSSQWSGNCQQCYNSANTYRVYLTNICDETLDVKIGVLEKETKKWRTFNHIKVAPKDSITGYACSGTGKYIFWARKTGDKEIVFPTDEEINLNFKK